MSGLDFLERVKIASDTRAIPILILSNVNSDNEYESSMKLGASDYLVKSTHSIDQVITKIDDIIRISELQ
jgi:DNA-binding response OmpR family regulator